MNSELLEFTRRSLDKGLSREKIVDVLKGAGWSPADISAATGAFADIDFPVPVPKPRPYLSAQEVFTHALFFFALYVSAYNLGSMLFHFIDLAYPDAAFLPRQRSYVYDSVRWNIAALIVAFPLFLFLFRIVTAAIAKDPTKHESRPRKWLTYMTLFLGASILLGDVAQLIYKTLGGELEIRFVLKVMTVAVIAGGPFAYFLSDIRRGEQS